MVKSKTRLPQTHTKVVAAAAQMTSKSNFEDNLGKIERFVKDARAQGAQLVTFPENFLFFADQTHGSVDFAHAHAERLLKVLTRFARDHSIWILAGSIAWPVKSSARGKRARRITNRSFLINPKGRVVAVYDKMHLFDALVTGDRTYQESKHADHGKKTTVAQILGQKMGLAICYDVRFPELFRKYSHSKASILTLPSAFTVPTGQAHWDHLTRARAIENLAYLIAPAQWGTHGEGEEARKTYGHSRIVSPWGEVLAELKEGEGLIVAELDFEVQRSHRERLPALFHRKIK